MRLAVFTNQFPGRVSTFFARDMRALLAADVNIEVFSIYPLDAALWKFVPAVLDPSVFPRNMVHHLGGCEAVKGIRVRSIRQLSVITKESWHIVRSACHFGIAPVAKSLYVVPKAWTWAAKQANKYDHVFGYWGNYSATCAYLFSRLKETPWSLFLHAGTDLYRDQVFLREKLYSASNIIVECEFNRRFLQELYPQDFQVLDRKIHVHYTGLDLENFPYGGNPRLPKRLLAVGRLDQKKGFAFLIRALARLDANGMSLECDLYGDGPERRSLERLASSLNILSRVRFKGWQTFDEVRRGMQEATVLVHPSPCLGDATPTVIKEALALGLPVVASDIAGIPELLDYGKCGVLVPPGDVRVLADSIARIISDDSLRQTFAAAGRRYAEQMFDMWKNGKRLKEVLLNSSFGPVNPKDAPSL